MAALLRGLREYTDQITAVVAVTDNGGSSGRLRNDFDIAAPGDIRNCLLALADVDPLMAKAFQYRFHEAEFKGHCFGNLFITVLARIVGGFQTSVSELNRLLHVRGRVIPAADQKVSLVARHPDGTKSTGEVQITKSGRRIQRVELRPHPIAPSVEIQEAIGEADFFLFGPGSLYTSVIPNLLLEGVMDMINATGKPRAYIGNIMTQRGETTGYRLSDHLRALRDHVGRDFPDVIFAHKGDIPSHILAKYKASGAEPVECDLAGRDEFRDVKLVQEDFFARDGVAGEQAGIVRHDSAVLAGAISQKLLAPLARVRTKRKTRKRGRRHQKIELDKTNEAKTSVRIRGTRTLRYDIE
jgi:uncharacterized cofD-like protein